MMGSLTQRQGSRKRRKWSGSATYGRRRHAVARRWRHSLGCATGSGCSGTARVGGKSITTISSSAGVMQSTSWYGGYRLRHRIGRRPRGMQVPLKPPPTASLLESSPEKPTVGIAVDMPRWTLASPTHCRQISQGRQQRLMFRLRWCLYL